MKFKLLFLLITILSFLAYLIWSFFVPLSRDSLEKVIFQVYKGEDVLEIAKRLKNENLIRNSFSFLVYLGILGRAKEVKAGVYEFSPKMSIAEIVKDLTEGNIAKVKITVLEGWNLKDIAEYFESLGFFSKEDFYKVAGYPPSENFSFSYQIPETLKEEFPFLKNLPQGSSLEGFLMPDTYFVKLKSSPVEIVKILLSNFQKKVLENKEIALALKNQSLFKVITLASLLEKEVKTFKDKQIVAGILIKRLNHKIPLQVDATLTYILGKKSTKISIKETKIKNPYNTYLYLGLPPGPIANPGLESIKAVLNPVFTDYWYYLSKPDGTTVFSRTFTEHVNAKNKYLK